MKRPLRALVLVVAAFVACSPFGKDSGDAPASARPAVDAGGQGPISEAGAPSGDGASESDGGPGGDTDSGDAEAASNALPFLVPLGSAGCTGTSVKGADFCTDFEAALDAATTGWDADSSGAFQLRVTAAAPSPSHYVQLSEANNTCQQERLDRHESSKTVSRIRFELELDVNSVGTTSDAFPTNFALFSFDTGTAASRTDLYLDVTTSHFLIHEAYTAAGPHDAEHALGGAVPPDWVPIQLVVNLEQHTATFTVQGAGTTTFVLGQPALGDTLGSFTYAVGFTCPSYGGTVSYDDVVVTFE